MRSRLLAAALSLTVCAGLLAQAGPVSAAAGAHGPGVFRAPVAGRLARPQAVLGVGWRRSADRAVTVAGDATGLRVLVADEAAGYAWRTVATLGSAAVDTPEWIGQACVTGGGTRAVVVYAPSQITSTPAALGLGARAAVVNLVTGRVTPVRAGVSIAYFDPGCGARDTAVLTQGGWSGGTRLLTLDAETGKITGAVRLPGQVTSAVPYSGGIAAAYGRGLVSVRPDGRLRLLATTAGTPFRLAPDGAGGLGFEVASGRSAQIRRYADGRDQLVATTALGAVELSQVGGRVFVTGPRAARLGRLPGDWRAVDAPAFAQVSTTGTAAFVATAGHASGPQQPGVTGWIAATGQRVSFRLNRSALAVAGVPTPRGSGSSPDPATTTWDPDRACSVPRNDPAIETYQPSDQQIQWAVDQAVRGTLTDRRGPDLYGSGLAAYRPQTIFPLPRLDGGGSIPPQVVLGIMAQESGYYQASSHVVTGQAGNVEPSFNWYGDDGDYSYVDWANADCGYGLAQVTTGMCRAGYDHCASPLPWAEQVAVDVDYQANIAAAAQVLAQKWNQLYQRGIKANDADPRYIEDWYLAIWAYNSGLEPTGKANGNTTGCLPGPACADSGGDWGLGWADNPANSAYPPDRPAFLAASKAQAPGGGAYTAAWDMTHPQYWPYQEKVIGWAFNGFSNWSYLQQRYVQAYDPGSWPKGTTSPAIAPHAQFCTTADHCDKADVPAGSVKDPADPCQLSGKLADHCWWHWPATWADCATRCGTGVFAYGPAAPDPADPAVPSGYAPDCARLPAPAVVVADTATSLPRPLGCGRSQDNGGVMTWQFGSASGHGAATYPSKIDFHQISAGYNGHFWFTHALQGTSASRDCTTARTASLAITGTWTPSRRLTGRVRIEVALPNVGAVLPDAVYRIVTGARRAPVYRIVSQDRGRDVWVSLGTYNLAAGAHVSLGNAACSGIGGDIAWDAVAFIPAR